MNVIFASSSDGTLSAMKFISIVLLSLATAACHTQAPEFSWYHPMGGEYLFDFDQNECQTMVSEQGLRLGSDPSGPFFSCMEQRGYSLITASVRKDPTPGWADLVTNGP